MNALTKILPQQKVKFTELTSFTRQFSAMLEAKISPVRIFEILFRQIETEYIKRTSTSKINGNK